MFKYNTNGQVIEETYLQTDALPIHYRYNFDEESGLLLSLSREYEESDQIKSIVTTFEYTYDEKGNWITMLGTNPFNGDERNTFFEATRTITYWEE